MILVVGATGTTGRLVVRELLDRGAPVRALTSSPEKAAELEALGAEVAVGDLDEPATLARAMRRVERMYLAQPEDDHQLQRELNAIALAEQAGAYAVVKLACSEPSPVHEEITRTLQASSLRWTILQPGTPMDAEEVAVLAARALTEEGHEGATYLVA